MIKNIQLADCFQAGGVRLERVKYFQRQLLTVDDMVTDQDYVRQKLRRHNRFLHGWGVVCGLVVTAAPIESAPWRVRIGEGYALGPFGDEIHVAEPVFLDLATCGPNDRTDPCDPGRGRGTRGTGGIVYVAIEYAECFSKPVRAMPAGCGCDDDPCEYSRIRDSFDLCCLTEAPPVDPVPSICDLIARRRPAPCPPCPSSPWVVLAQVNLPSATAMNLTNQAINISVRKPLYRTELLQAQIIHCCCKPEAPVPVTVTNTVPAAGAAFSTSNSPTSVVITFSKALQPATVNTSSIIVTTSGRAVPGTVSYDDGNHTGKFAPQRTGPFPAGAYTVTVKGSGANAIKDVDDLALDGNADGTGGDDYSFNFTVAAGTSGPA